MGAQQWESPDVWLLPLDTHRTPTTGIQKFLDGLTDENDGNFRPIGKFGSIPDDKVGNAAPSFCITERNEISRFIHEAENAYLAFPVHTNQEFVIRKSRGEKWAIQRVQLGHVLGICTSEESIDERINIVGREDDALIRMLCPIVSFSTPLFHSAPP